MKPCPFCGGKPTVIKGRRYEKDGLHHREGDWIWRPLIGCKKCSYSKVGDSSEELNLWWNQRP